MKRFSWIFMMLLSGPLWAGVGGTDGRREIDDTEWAKHPYNKYALYKEDIDNGYFRSCTAQYVSSDILLTAAHCVRVPQGRHYAQVSDGKIFEITLLKTGPYTQTEKPSDDWALFRITDNKYHRNDFFDYGVLNGQTANVISAGFGNLRVLSDNEITTIQAALANETTPATIDDFLAILEKINLEDLFNDGTQLKAMTCNVQRSNQPSILVSETCDIWAGNSGGAIIDTDGKYIYGISHSATQYELDAFRDRNNISEFISTEQFKDAITEIIKGNTLSATLNSQEQVQNEDHPEENQTATLQTAIVNTEIELAQYDNEIESELPQIKENSKDPKKLLVFLGTVAERQEVATTLENLRKAYEKAKTREQSFSNRTLTAATVAATGLGGMQLAEGIAEQNADREAEREMSAYITTMKCEYGKGQQVTLGNEDVTLPGGNDLLGLYTEYKQTAERLKTTKAALGLRPGIESEVLYDKAQTGLYQYANTGKTGGGYTSLYNALTDETGADAAAWASQKEISAQKVKAGAAVGGVGAIGGAAGNLLINKDLYFGNQSE